MGFRTKCLGCRVLGLFEDLGFRIQGLGLRVFVGSAPPNINSTPHLVSYCDTGLVLAMFTLGRMVGEEIRGMVKASGLPPKPSTFKPKP